MEFQLVIKNMMDDQDIKVAATEEDLAVVRDIIRTITKTVKTFNVYPKDNPIYQKFATELFEKFNSFFETGDELKIDIDQYSLLYKESEVYHNEEKTDNIAMHLFSDGIRQITFDKGITFDEIRDFIDILRFAPKSDISDDDDIVTLLWEKNIKNMSYTAVEDTVDDDLVVDEAFLRSDPDQDISEDPSADIEAILASTGNGFPSETKVEQLTESELAALRKELAAIDDLVVDEAFLLNDLDQDISKKPSADTGTLPDPAGTVFPPETKVEQLTESEFAPLKKELAAIDEQSLLASAVDLFFGLLTDEQDTEAFPEIVLNIGKIMDIRMQGKDLKGVIEILQGLKKFLEVCNTPSQRETLEDVFFRAGSSENVKVLIEGSQDAVEIRQYLFLMGPQFLAQMIQVLGELNDRKHRRLLCEILAEIGKQDINALAVALDDEKWYLVRNIAMVLGMIKAPGSEKHLEKALKHTDVRVRRETIRALDGISGGETKNLFLAALEDSDVTIRITALKALKRSKATGLFDVLSKNISRDDLREKPFAEKKELLETIAVLGGEEAFPLLSELFGKKGFIEKDEITEIRAAAAYGLGLLKSKEAIVLLEKETNSKKSVLREACVKALGKY
jgi:hypothetical protein